MNTQCVCFDKQHSLTLEVAWPETQAKDKVHALCYTKHRGHRGTTAKLQLNPVTGSRFMWQQVSIHTALRHITSEADNRI